MLQVWLAPDFKNQKSKATIRQFVLQVGSKLFEQCQGAKDWVEHTQDDYTDADVTMMNEAMHSSMSLSIKPS